MSRDFKWFIRNAVLGLSHPRLLSIRLWYNTKRTVANNLFMFKYYNYPYKIIFLAGMPLSATTWMKTLLARIPGYFTRPAPMPQDITYNADICDSAFSYTPRYGYTLFKTHLTPSRENLACLLRNEVKKILVTHRDLRDVAVSRYYRLVDFPKPQDAFDFVDYQMMGREKALNHSIDVIGTEYVSWIRGWLEIARKDPERYHFSKFEELKKDTKGTFLKALNFYGIELSDKKIDEIIEAAKGRKNVKQNMAEFKLLPLAYSSNFRSGKIGGWKDELSDAQIEKCKDLLGPTLIELGYEKDLSW